MKTIATLLDERLVVLDADVETAEDCIRLMAGLFEKYGYVKPGYGDAVAEREKGFPTGLPGKGINLAIPHTNNALVNKPAVGVIIPRKPVEFAMMGQKDTKLSCEVVLPLVVQDSKRRPARHPGVPGEAVPHGGRHLPPPAPHPRDQEQHRPGAAGLDEAHRLPDQHLPGRRTGQGRPGGGPAEQDHRRRGPGRDEPVPAGDPLLELDNLTMTPHTAGNVVDALPKSPLLLARVILDYWATGKSDMVVNLRNLK